MRRSLLWTCLLAITACGHDAPRPRERTAAVSSAAPVAVVPDAPPAPAARTLAADEVVRTASGATMTLPSGWTVEVSPRAIRSTAPEGDLVWTHVELPADEPDPARAAIAAWTQVVPGFALSVARVTERPPRDGWESTHQIVFATPEAGRKTLAVLRRYHATWHADLVDGTAAAFERRAAQLLGNLQSLRPDGLVQETFHGPARTVDASFEAELDRYVTAAMAAAKVPGLAIAIVQHGKLAIARGWGVRELGKPARVGPDTRFLIGSTTKSLTTLMMARLVDAGAVQWDTPASRLLPQLAGTAAGALELRQTVCACSGMPADTDWVFSFDYAGATPDGRLTELAAITPTTRPGETFQYSNAMVAAGGFAAARAHVRGGALGPAYDRAMDDLVFAPLAMTSTTFDFARVARGEHATPHAPDLAGALVAQPLSVEMNAIAVRPAGAAWSTVRDLARVILLELGRGTLDGKQLVSPDNLTARRTPRVKITDDLSYGLGMFVERDHGVDVVGHPGNNVGFTTDLFFLPEHDVGAVVLINAGLPNAFRAALRRRLIELWFGATPRAEADLAAAIAAAGRGASERAARLHEPEPAWLAPLLGVWTAPGLGRIELRRDRGRTVLDAGEWVVPVAEERGADGSRRLVTTGAPWPDLALVPRRDGAAPVLVIDEGGHHQRVFVRAAPPPR